MNKNAVFVMLLAGPSTSLYLLSSVASTPLLGSLSATLTVMAITLCPFFGALLFERNESLILSLLIPFALTLARAINFEGAERLVVAALIVFVVASVVSWLLGYLTKYVYARYFRKAI